LTGRSIYETDRGHMHHCFLKHGYSGGRTLFWIGVLCIGTSFGALFSVAFQNEWLAFLSVVCVCGILIFSRVFGHSECMLLLRLIKTLISSFSSRPSRRERPQLMPIQSRLTDSKDWEILWETLTEYAERFDLSSVQLNINLPAINEVYYANWERRTRKSELHVWTSEIPLMAHQHTVGKLRIRGEWNEGHVCQWMGDLLTGLHPFETQLVQLVIERFDQTAATSQSHPQAQGANAIPIDVCATT